MASSNTLPSGMGDFQICDTDTASDPQYFGYQRSNGQFYIMKQSGSNMYRYVFGKDNYSTAWSNRSSLGYDYIQGAF